MSLKPWIIQNQLLQAIQSNDINMAENLFEQGVDVDSILYSSHHGKPAICICVERGYYEMAKVLVRRGCSLSLTTANGFTPLHLAAMYADSKIVELLLQNRANVRALDRMGHTALHIACSRTSKVDIVQALIDMGSDCNKLDDEGRSPLFSACIQGCHDTISCLLKNGADVNIADESRNSPLLYAVVHKSLSLTRVLIEAGADVNLVNMFDETPLLSLIRNHDFYYNENDVDLPIVDLLISEGSNLNATTCLGQTPLHLAVCQRRIALTQKLINKGCDVNAFDKLGHSPLFYACRDDCKNMALMLVAAGTDLSRQNWFQDEQIIQACSREFIEWLVQKSHNCRSLSELCVLTVRKYFEPIVELAMEKSDLPSLLKNKITLNAYR